MPIDFSREVLGPAMDTFAIPITVTPTVSQPGKPSYPNRGVWTVQDTDIVLEDGSRIASKTIELGIRYFEYPVPPVKGDGVQITLQTYGGFNYGATVNRGFANPANYLIDQVRPDGQGGARLVLKALQP